MRLRVLLLLLVGIGVRGAWAATDSLSLESAPESKSSMGIKDVIGDKKFEEDKAITDLELRSYAGSLNRYSLQTTLGYSGPPVNQLSDPNKPNPDNRPGDNRTLLSGTMGLRYRVTSDSAVNLTTGVGWFTPYQAVKNEPVDRPSNTKTYDVSNPGVSYDTSYAVGPTQGRSSFRATAETQTYYVQQGQWGGVGYSQYLKYTPLMGRVILGVQLALDYFMYDRDFKDPDARGKNGDGKVSRYYMNLIPSFEYKITDAVNFNTSLGYPYQNLRGDHSWWNWSHPLSTWRLGLGWAITHDIYINPYVNFYAESPAFDTASLNFNTTFSIF